MKWWIAIFVAVLASGVQAQEQTAVQVVKHATGTLDYENVGEHDCKPDIEVPVRFVAKNVELKMSIVGQRETRKIRRGVEVTEYEIPSRKIDRPSDFPINGFLLDVDVTYCIAPFATDVSSGRWKVWHEDGEADLVVSGILSSEEATQDDVVIVNGTSRFKITSRNGRTVYSEGYFDGPEISISAYELGFPRLHKADGSLSHVVEAKATIELEPANTSEEVSNE